MRKFHIGENGCNGCDNSILESLCYVDGVGTYDIDLNLTTECPCPDYKPREESK